MDFLQQVVTLFIERADWFGGLLVEHIVLSAIAIVIAGVLGLLFGILISEYRRFAPLVIGICNVVYTIPSIALLGLLIPLLGIGGTNAIVALIIYALMPMVRNTYVGLTDIDPDIIEAARGMGSTRFQTLVHVRLPMATSVILAGVRSMVVMTISVAAIASFIGAGGLGAAIYRGITMNNFPMIFAGSVLVALLAFVADLLLGFAERRYQKKRRLLIHEKH
ncbi:ABC transporter permease [Raoultibacter phocaeensis]|uniref:ABC transporter permease n=1 Tax=Raoultibacter phocaeensis TaxID=2479841 RepID=UPI0011195382|nr:ABC transporter permease [Raoultibacter phocaeensis]